MIKKCTKCDDGDINYDMTELHLIPNTTPQEAGYEGLCDNCNAHYYLKFRLYAYEVIEFDDFMNEKEKEVIPI